MSPATILGSLPFPCRNDNADPQDVSLSDELAEKRRTIVLCQVDLDGAGLPPVSETHFRQYYDTDSCSKIFWPNCRPLTGVCQLMADIKAVILAGGMGTRLIEETQHRPKPMVEIGGMPILWHIMKIYSAHGINEFIVCCGYKGHMIKEFFANYFCLSFRHDLRSRRQPHRVARTQRRAVAGDADRYRRADADRRPAEAGRALRQGRSLFCFTYGDGVGDIDMTGLDRLPPRARARSPPSPPCSRRAASASLSLDKNRILGFQEKPSRRQCLGQRRLLRAVAEGDRPDRGRRHGLGARAAGDASPARATSPPIVIRVLASDGFHARPDDPGGNVEHGPRAVEDRGERAAFWTGRRVFVTGHTGFKGAWLTLWLTSLGADVAGYALEPPTTPSLFDTARIGDGIRSTIGDVADRRALRAALAAHRPEIVFHLAAQALVRRSYADPVETFADQCHGHGPSARRRPRRARCARDRGGDQRQVLRQPRIAAGLSRERPDGWPRSLFGEQGRRPRSPWRRCATPSSPARMRHGSPRCAPAMSSAAATGRSTGWCQTSFARRAKALR